jgi:L-fuculose-phosphate aldolase
LSELEDELGAALQALVACGRRAVADGLVSASGGNLSARVGEGFVVTRRGAWLDALTVEDVVRVEGGTVPAEATSEIAVHLAAYGARADVAAVLHLHPQTAVMLDARGDAIRAVTTDHRYYVRNVVTTEFARPGSQELADVVQVAVGGGADIVILRGHGVAVVGPDVETAYRRAVNLEQAARMTRDLLLLGDKHTGRPVV